jgi:hypothetical protein
MMFQDFNLLMLGEFVIASRCSHLVVILRRPVSGIGSEFEFPTGYEPRTRQFKP